MRTLASLLFLAAAPAFAAAQATKEDLKKLAKSGVSEEVILTFIKTHGYAGKPSSDDLVELKAAGLSDKVLAGLLTPAPAAPAEEPPTTSPPTSTYATGSLAVGPVYNYPASYAYVAYPSYYYRYGYWAPYYARAYYSCHPYYRPYYRAGYYGRPPYHGSYYRGSGSYYRTADGGGRYVTGTMSRR